MNKAAPGKASTALRMRRLPAKVILALVAPPVDRVQEAMEAL